VIWFSVLGAAPFTLLLPYMDLFWTGVLSVVIGIIISSAFPAILVYAQELLPKNSEWFLVFYGFVFWNGWFRFGFIRKSCGSYQYYLCL
jgi:FSR family fosmidomycin resistance protein-like MFS transporter